MIEKHFYVVSYDIVDDRRRARVAKILADYGDRVQYSVFELLLRKAEQLTEMERRLSRVVDTKEDSIRIYSLCASCLKRVRIIGRGEVLDYKPAYVV